MQVLSVDGHIIVVSNDLTLLSWFEQEFKNTDGAWICEYGKIFKINEKLKEYGHCIADSHVFFIPSDRDKIVNPNFHVQWYEKNELLTFIDGDKFPNALGKDSMRPDILAVAAVINEEIAGMAGASADSSMSWQIGVDVLPQYRHKKIATTLTTLLSREISKRGFLPFYGTGASHVQSLRVAVGAGFIPAWWELYTKKIL